MNAAGESETLKLSEVSVLPRNPPHLVLPARLKPRGFGRNRGCLLPSLFSAGHNAATTPRPTQGSSTAHVAVSGAHTLSGTAGWISAPGVSSFTPNTERARPLQEVLDVQDLVNLQFLNAPRFKA